VGGAPGRDDGLIWVTTRALRTLDGKLLSMRSMAGAGIIGLRRTGYPHGDDGLEGVSSSEYGRCKHENGWLMEMDIENGDVKKRRPFIV